MADADVIVVGAGHNGLIAAAYLARAGIDTLLLESRAEVGGVSSTVSDLGARFNICNCDHSLIRAMPIVDELDLESHGLDYVENEAGGVVMYHDGSDPWVMFRDIERTVEGIAERFPSQVDAYRRYLGDALPVAELALEMAHAPARAGSMLKRAVGRRGRGAARLVEWSRRSAQEVLARYFDDWHLSMPAISLGPTIWGAPPDVPGTGLGAAGYATRHLMKSGRPRGGSGGLGRALQSSFESAGGQVRCNASVQSLVVDEDTVKGVQLADGTTLLAHRVVTACDPRAVLVDWIDEPPPAARRLIRRWAEQPEPDGYQSKVDAVLRGLPRHGGLDRVPASAAGVDLLGPTTVVVPSPDQLAEAHRLRAVGRVADYPTFLINVPSVPDPDMQPVADQHVLSLEVLFTPYVLDGGWEASSEPERWLDLWANLMGPGARDLISDWRAMTPDRYEREFSMRRGHTPSYTGAPLATLTGRQRELSRYRTPIKGLYLSGAGTYPGAGVFGAAGRNTATVVRHDVAKAPRL